MTRLRYFLLGAVACIATSAIAYPILDPGVGVVQGSGYPAFGADTTVTVTASSARVELSSGFYAISCPVVVYADQDTAESVAATVSERRIPANYVYPLRTDSVTGEWVALIATNAAVSGAICNVSRDSYR